MKAATYKPGEVIAILTNGKVMPAAQMIQEKIANIESIIQETQHNLETSRSQYEENDEMIADLLQKRQDLSESIDDMEQYIRLLEAEKEHLNGWKQ